MESNLLRELNENLKRLLTPNKTTQSDEEKIAEYSRIRKEKAYKNSLKKK